MKKAHNFFLFKISSTGMYIGFCAGVQFLKAAENSSFGPSLIHHFRRLGSQQDTQSGALLTSFSTWGTENNTAEINLEITGWIKGCNIFWGQKMANTCSFVGVRVEQNVHTTFCFPNPLLESEELQSWGCSKILLSFLMRFDGHF
jgi:hypothetical protein